MVMLCVFRVLGTEAGKAYRVQHQVFMIIISSRRHSHIASVVVCKQCVGCSGVAEMGIKPRRHVVRILKYGQRLGRYNVEI